MSTCPPDVQPPRPLLEVVFTFPGSFHCRNSMPWNLTLSQSSVVGCIVSSIRTKGLFCSHPFNKQNNQKKMRLVRWLLPLCSSSLPSSLHSFQTQQKGYTGGGGTHPYKAGFGGCAARMLAPRKPRQGNLIFESSLVYMIIPRPAKAIYRASLSLSLSLKSHITNGAM